MVTCASASAARPVYVVGEAVVGELGVALEAKECVVGVNCVGDVGGGSALDICLAL